MDYTDCTNNPALFAECILNKKPAFAEINEDDEGTVTLDYNEERGENYNLIICWGEDHDSVFPGHYRGKNFPNVWAFMSDAQGKACGE